MRLLKNIFFSIFVLLILIINEDKFFKKQVEKEQFNKKKFESVLFYSNDELDYNLIDGSIPLALMCLPCYYDTISYQYKVVDDGKEKNFENYFIITKTDPTISFSFATKEDQNYFHELTQKKYEELKKKMLYKNLKKYEFWFEDLFFVKYYYVLILNNKC